MNSPNQNQNFNDKSSEHMKRQDYYDYENEDEMYEEVSFDDLEHLDSISHVHSDEELELVIKELLMNSSKIDASDITVTVSNCNAKLSGTVKSQFDRDYAVSIVKLVHGVGDVRSELVVKLNPGISPGDIGRNPN